jgi:hypothetical protein
MKDLKSKDVTGPPL